MKTTKTLMKLLPVSLIALLCGFNAGAQNSLSLQFEDGAPFKVLVGDKVCNKSPQSQVLVTGLKQDTLHIKVEMEKGERFGLTFYLLDKGKPTDHKEFSYLLRREKNKVKPMFMGVYDENNNTKEERPNE